MTNLIIAVIALAIYSVVVTCVALYQRNECNNALNAYDKLFYQRMDRAIERDRLAAENRDLREIESKRAEAMNVINGEDNSQ